MKNIFVQETYSIHKVLERLQKTGEKCLLVVKKNKVLLGTITDGDIRRAILKKTSTNSIIKNIYKKNCKSIYHGDISLRKARDILKSSNLPLIPIINKNRKVINYVSLLNTNTIKNKKKIETEVVVMAGGEGTRLRPLTHVLPKPLIPLDNKTVIENIIDNFTKYQIKKFIISINFKSEMIKSFFKELQPKYNYRFIEEKSPLGTAGSLAFLKPKKRIDYIITNCDTLIDFDCNEFFKHHKENKNDITILASSKEFKIPYGLCKISKNGILQNIVEKPSQHHLVNTGIYIVNSKILRLIKKKKYLDFNNFILLAKKRKKKISIFPISETSWFDTGQWEEYLKTKKNYDKK